MPTPQRNTVPIRWVPRGCCDSADGTNSPQGSMAALTNLIPDPTTAGVWVPRPAATEQTAFAGFSSPGVVSGLLVVGDIAYGLVASAANSGKDEPFAYNLATGAFLTVAGIASTNVPTTQPTSGDWTPPILCRVGPRVIVTHPGFAGGAVKFGWFDISNFSAPVIGDTISGQPFIFGNPGILGVQPGMTVSGAGIPANTSVVATYPVAMAFLTTGDTHGTALIDSVYDLAALVMGASVTGPGIQNGTTIVGTGGTGPHSWTITLSQPTTTSGSAVSIIVSGAGGTGGRPNYTADTTAGSATLTNFSGDANSALYVGNEVLMAGVPTPNQIVSVDPMTFDPTLNINATATATGQTMVLVGTAIQLSANATATANGVTFQVAGGTATAPLWGAGDTDRNPLPSQPVGVAQFNGRAYYALGTDGIVYSDSLLPCRVSNTTAVQALTTGDGLAVTALAPLLLGVPLTGGIVQALLAFEGQTKIQQITGDQVNGNLAMNLLPVATGTLAPLSLAPSELGTAFASPEGLRFVRFDGTVSEPVGEGGDGIVTPFQFAVSPSRICAAANGGVLRITVQNGAVAGAPFQEWWYDLRRKVWSGPHSFTARLIQPWRGSFLLAPLAVAASLWQSDWFANNTSGYVENGAPLSWRAATVLLPDNAQIVMNAMVEGSIALAADVAVSVAALDEDGNVLDSVDLPTGDLNLRQLPLYWHAPIVFKQMSIAASGESDFTVRVGNLYLRYEILGYNSAIVSASLGYLLADDGVTILADNPGSTLLTPG